MAIDEVEEFSFIKFNNFHVLNTWHLQLCARHHFSHINFQYKNKFSIQTLAVRWEVENGTSLLIAVKRIEPSTHSLKYHPCDIIQRICRAVESKSSAKVNVKHYPYIPRTVQYIRLADKMLFRYHVEIMFFRKQKDITCCMMGVKTRESEKWLNSLFMGNFMFAVCSIDIPKSHATAAPIPPPSKYFPNESAQQYCMLFPQFSRRIFIQTEDKKKFKKCIQIKWIIRGKHNSNVTNSRRNSD